MNLIKIIKKKIKMGCDNSQSYEEEDSVNDEEVIKNSKKKEIIEDSEESEIYKKKTTKKEERSYNDGNKANKDNKKNKKDKRKKRDIKKQKEFTMSDNSESISNSDSYDEKKKKNKLRALKKRKNSENSNSASDNDKEDINTEGMATVETRKLNIKKKENEGVLIMEGIEDLIPEDLTEDDLYQLVEDALSDNIIEDEENQVPGTITRKQVKSISKLLYKKLKKKKGEHDIDISEYPELKGLNVKIGAGKLTKDVIKKMMYSNKNVDDNQIDTAYNNLTKNNNDIKALTIELMTEENTNNDTDNKNQENNNKEEENKNNDK